MLSFHIDINSSVAADPDLPYRSQVHYHKYQHLRRLASEYLAENGADALRETAHPTGGVTWNPETVQ